MPVEPQAPLQHDWSHALAHRDLPDRDAYARRLEAADLTPAHVLDALADGGDKLYAAAVDHYTNFNPHWADQFGGPLPVCLLAQEVSAYTAHLTARAAQVRGAAIHDLLDDYSAVAVANTLGVSRQKVYDLARGHEVSVRDFITKIVKERLS